MAHIRPDFGSRSGWRNRDGDINRNCRTDRDSDTERNWRRDRDGDTERNWRRDRDGDTERNWRTDRDSDTERNWRRDRDGDTERNWRRDRDGDTERNWRRDRDGDTERNWRTDRDSDRERNWRTDRDSDRERNWRRDRDGDTERNWRRDRDGDTERNSRRDRDGDTERNWRRDRDGDTKRNWRKDGDGATERNLRRDRDGEIERNLRRGESEDRHLEIRHPYGQRNMSEDRWSDRNGRGRGNFTGKRGESRTSEAIVAKYQLSGGLDKSSRGRGREMRNIGSGRQRNKGIADDDNGSSEKPKRSDKPYFGIGYTILKSWSENEDNEDLLLQMSNKFDAMHDLLMRNDIKEDWFTLLVKAISKVISCHHYVQKLKKLLTILSTTHFLTQMLTNYLDQKQELGVRWTDAEDFYNSFLKILRQILISLPERAQSCKVPVRILESMLEDIEPLSSNQEIKNSISGVSSSIKETQQILNEKQTNKLSRLPSADKEKPPEDFRELSVIPTHSDLFTNLEPFLRKVITKGQYRDQNHYLDIQFRLMREDFIKPLRNGILEFREIGSGNKFKSSDIRIYNNAHFTGLIGVNEIHHVVQFDVKQLKNVKWDHSKRLLCGNLLCLSNDNFKSTLIFATVSARDRNDLNEGMVTIVCHSGLDIVMRASYKDTFIMAETMAYYEAMHPILRGLQIIDSDLPFKQHIISCEKTLKPPSYLLKGVFKYDISCLMNPISKTRVSVLNTLSWPPAESMCLNSSQRDAVILALTKEIAIIQGPPGTGKTYVGLKVMHTLLENQDCVLANEISDHDPILVICYTNHALDQFLEGILDFCPEGMVRIGGKSSSVRLEPFMLMELKKKTVIESKAWKKALWDLRDELKIICKQIKEAKSNIDCLMTDILSENTLVKYMCEKHYDDLQSGPWESSKRSKIHQWLNASKNSFRQTLPIMIQQHMTKLVMKCLQMKLWRLDKDRKFSPGACILDRVYWYRKWYRKWRNKYQHQRPNPELFLSDDEICSAISEQHYIENLYSYFYEIRFSNYEDAKAIESWVLGLHNEFNKQLNDVEELTGFINKSMKKETEEDVKCDDDFDDEEEAENEQRHRQFIENERDELEKLKAISHVRNEDAYLLNRVRLLSINEEISDVPDKGDVQADEMGFQVVTHKKKLTFSQIQRMLSDDKIHAIAKHEEESKDDLWSLNMNSRFALYKLWVNRHKDFLVSQIEILMQKYIETKQELNETKMKEDIDVLRRAKVIGMTTTGAAKNKALLDAIGCRIIIVEEAAEVLEAHVVTALNKNCKHLILIGDHKQLRPNPTVYEHAKIYGLDVSLFERLINNDIPHVTLNEQHRMRQSISVIMRHIYPDLKDHVSVMKYENIRGVCQNVYFIQHDHLEESVSDSLSKSNTFEAEYLVQLCRYFLNQGYKPSQITILATYAGQVFALKKEMNNKDINHGVRVTVVDNFQGEENDIILLSLVRSNEENNVGFLKIDNRVCVALSRAKKGMFAICNLKLLASQSKLWDKIKQTAEQEKITGNKLPLSCPNHPDKINFIEILEDFKKCPEGGCIQDCDFRLTCGHTCYLKCHGYDLEHKSIQCIAPCIKSCPVGHPCRKKCYLDCGFCNVIVPKQIPTCGHTQDFHCYQTPKDTDCETQCETVLPCDHQCPGKCGQCKIRLKHELCQVRVSYFWPCGHTVQVPCFYTPGENPCPKECQEILKCGHRCKGSCSACLKGAVHVECKATCGKSLPCGHKCTHFCGVPCPPCQRPCPVKCRHTYCSHVNKKRKCGVSCIQCQDPCNNSCPHRTCSRRCFEECDVEPCQRKCKKLLTHCNHPCASLCGELCVCKECNTVSKCQMSNSVPSGQPALILKLPTCGHIFKVMEIDNYVLTMCQKLFSEFICCPDPECSTPMQLCSRYEKVLKRNASRREKEKAVVLNLQSLTPLKRSNIASCLALLKEKDASNHWHDWGDIDEEKIKTFGEFQTISCKVNFAYAVNEIQALDPISSDFNLNKQVEDMISALLKINCITFQQLEEFKLDLKRLLVWKYLDVLQKMSVSQVLPFDINDSSVLVSLKAPKIPNDFMKDAMSYIDSFQNAIQENEDPTTQAMLLLKKKVFRRVLDILEAVGNEAEESSSLKFQLVTEEEEMLCEILTDFVATKRPVIRSKYKDNAHKAQTMKSGNKTLNQLIQVAKEKATNKKNKKTEEAKAMSIEELLCDLSGDCFLFRF